MTSEDAFNRAMEYLCRPESQWLKADVIEALVHLRSAALGRSTEKHGEILSLASGFADQIAALERENAKLKAEREDCPTCAGDGVIFGVTTKAEGEDWVERVDSESIDPCPECEGTKRSLVARQKAEIAALKEAGRRLDSQMKLCAWTWTHREGEHYTGVRFSDISAERDALRALCAEDSGGAAAGTVPVPATPAEMPADLHFDDLINGDKKIAYCHKTDSGERIINFPYTQYSKRKMELLAKWLPGARAWQKEGL